MVEVRVELFVIREMSFRELERLSRGYVRAIRQIVGPTKDIPAQMYSQTLKLWHG